jgi:hypothetical protein
MPDSQDSSGKDQDLLDEMDCNGDEGGSEGPKHEVVTEADRMLGRGAMSAPEKSTKKKRKVAPVEEDDIPEEAGSTMSSQLAHLETADPLMFDVAKKHHKITGRATPPCLLMLTVAKQFQGDTKIGHVLNGVLSLFVLRTQNHPPEQIWHTLLAA